MHAEQDTAAGQIGAAVAPDWHALYLELGTASSAYMRVCDAVKRGEADGGDYWEAFGRFSTLVGQAICWRDCPDEYAAALERQRLARLAEAQDASAGRAGE